MVFGKFNQGIFTRKFQILYYTEAKKITICKKNNTMYLIALQINQSKKYLVKEMLNDLQILLKNFKISLTDRI